MWDEEMEDVDDDEYEETDAGEVFEAKDEDALQDRSKYYIRN